MHEDEIRRRKFLKLIGAGASAAALPLGTSACGASARDDQTAYTGPELPFRTPNSLMDASRSEFDARLHVLDGEMPRDLTGHAFTICSIPYGDGTPLFTGDGMMLRVDFGDARPTIRTRLSKTPSYYVDEAVKGTEDAFQNRGFVRLSSKWGVRNFANTAYLRMDGRLLATFDAGRPFEIDPETLELITPVGAQSEWKPALPSGISQGPFDLQFSTAHPYHDERTGEFFSVNFRPSLFGDTDAFTDLVRWDGSGELEHWQIELPDGSNVVIEQSMHQLGVTEDYVVIMDTALRIEQEQFADPDVTRPQLPNTVVYVMRRDDLSPGSNTVEARKVVIPRESVHFLLDYENPEGKITMHLVHACTGDASEWLRAGDELYNRDDEVREELVGAPPSATDITMMGRHVLDGDSGRLIDSKVVYDRALTWGVSLYTRRGTKDPGRHENIYWVSSGFSDDNVTERMVETYRDYPYRTYDIDDLPFGGRPGTLFRLDTRRMAFADGYIFPDGRYPLSPTFVPRAGSSEGDTDGYIICTVMSDDHSWDKSTGDEFWIFDAADLEQGPICRLAHPELNMPFTIHTTWLPDLKGGDTDYAVTAQEDFAEDLEDQPDDVRETFEEEVYPHFDGRS